jgi:hypothetical protein
MNARAQHRLSNNSQKKCSRRMRNKVFVEIQATFDEIISRTRKSGRNTGRKNRASHL